MNNEEKIIFGNQWISIIETPRKFYFSQRKGKDSVAVFLLRKGDSEKEVLIRYQSLCIDNEELPEGGFRLYPCPITGSVENGEEFQITAKREVLEEAGYDVDVSYLGKYVVGTQTNEICYIYFADVSNYHPSEALGDGSYFESISQNKWHPISFLLDCEYSACSIGYLKLHQKGLCSAC